MLDLSRLQSGEMAILKEVVSGKKIMTAYKINENHVFLCLNQKEDKKLSTK